MVLEDSIEVMRGSTYEQVESEREDRGSKEKDRCPLTIPRLSSQRTTNARLIRDQVIAEFHTSSPDGSFKFQEVPSYLALHNLSLLEITSETGSESTSQPTSPTSASTQPLSPVLPIAMAAPSTMPPRGHGSAPKFTPDVPRELQRYFKELELLFGPAQIVDNTEKKKHAC
jgi:hypothetical protein